MAFISISNGAILPEQFTRYVIPYAAICASLLFFAALQPLFFRLKRLAFPVGIASAFVVFFVVELLFESMQIHVSGMSLVDTATLIPAPGSPAPETAPTMDIWQAALCVASPVMRAQSLTFGSQDSYYYIIGNSAYKIHYYLISLILISMVCGLVYGIAKMLRNGDFSQKKPVFLRGISTAALVALCVFANTTAFFRQPTLIQTPLASVLTALFFVVLGASAGIYVGSYLLKTNNIDGETALADDTTLIVSPHVFGKRPGLGVPALVSLCTTVAMYAGEAAMMGGNLYRFGRGWFFDGLPGIVLAPVDILVVLLSGALTCGILFIARRRERWPGKRTLAAAVAVCLCVAAVGPVMAMAAPDIPDFTDDDILGCYVFERNIYTNPLSSFMAFGGLPYVYGFFEDSFVIADTGGGGTRSYFVEYYNSPVGADEFYSKSDFPLGGSLFSLPGLSRFDERYLLAVMSDDSGAEFGLYRFDDEIWLVELRGIGIWTIYRLQKTDATTLADLEYVIKYYTENPAIELPSGVYENQMTLSDVFALARKGDALEPGDFEPFYYNLSGSDFTKRRYDVIGADVVFVRITGDRLESAMLWSRRTTDMANAIDLRSGFEAVAEYLNPLNNLRDYFTLEGVRGGEGVRELIYEYDYDMCRYYFSSGHADGIVVVFDSGERMPLKQALEERRVSIEDAVASGLGSVIMVPIDNLQGGEFTILHHRHVFTLNREEFYPSKSYMYVVSLNEAFVYFDFDELCEVLRWYGYAHVADRLLREVERADFVSIARGRYVSGAALAGLGVTTDVGWALSSHTPVAFNVDG